MSDFLTRIAERIRPGPPMVHPLAIPIFERVDSGFELAPDTGAVAPVQSERRATSVRKAGNGDITAVRVELAPPVVGAYSQAGAFLEREPRT